MSRLPARPWHPRLTGTERIGQVAEVGMTDQPHARLPEDVRDRLIRLLAGELGDAWDAATAAGADPDSLAPLIERRRRSVEESDPS